MPITGPDLTKQPPRSGRVRLGGYCVLPRMLDKGRATINGKNGDYHYNCPLDQYFTAFVGIDADALKEQLAAGKGDGEILEWIQANAKTPRREDEIAAWTAYMDQRAPGNMDSRDYFHSTHSQLASKREDIVSWFDLLDLDDFVSYGGKP
jgi:hypothetical protein